MIWREHWPWATVHGPLVGSPFGRKIRIIPGSVHRSPNITAFAWVNSKWAKHITPKKLEMKVGNDIRRGLANPWWSNPRWWARPAGGRLWGGTTRNRVITIPDDPKYANTANIRWCQGFWPTFANVDVFWLYIQNDESLFPINGPPQDAQSFFFSFKVRGCLICSMLCCVNASSYLPTRALFPSHQISPEIRESVAKASRKLGYRNQALPSQTATLGSGRRIKSHVFNVGPLMKGCDSFFKRHRPPRMLAKEVFGRIHHRERKK